jgi:hypothetical protein
LINIPDKLKYLLEKNEGYKTIKTYSEVENQIVNLYITPIFLNYFKYAPITSVNVECIFSLYKHILSNRRYYFQKHNLEMYLIIILIQKNYLFCKYYINIYNII